MTDIDIDNIEILDGAINSQLHDLSSSGRRPEAIAEAYLKIATAHALMRIAAALERIDEKLNIIGQVIETHE